MEERQILAHSINTGVTSFWNVAQKALRQNFYVMLMKYYLKFKISLKDTYLGGTTPTALQNNVSTCRQMYYDRETLIMVNRSVNEFYTWFLFKIDALPQDVAFPLVISSTFFKNLSPDVRELLISEGVQVPPMPPTENNHQGNQRLLLVKNTAVEAK